jgi:hypothetical protein
MPRTPPAARPMARMSTFFKADRLPLGGGEEYLIALLNQERGNKLIALLELDAQ